MTTEFMERATADQWRVYVKAARAKGFGRNAYLRYMGSKAWKIKREAVIKAAGGCCEVCLANDAVNAHHLNYKTLGDEDMESLKAVCAECHALLHAGKATRNCPGILGVMADVFGEMERNSVEFDKSMEAAR